MISQTSVLPRWWISLSAGHCNYCLFLWLLGSEGEKAGRENSPDLLGSLGRSHLDFERFQPLVVKWPSPLHSWALAYFRTKCNEGT